MRKNAKTLKLNRDVVYLMGQGELDGVAGATAVGGCSFTLCDTVFGKSGCPGVSCKC